MRRLLLLLIVLCAAGPVAGAQIQAPKSLYQLKKGSMLAVGDWIAEGQYMLSANGRFALTLAKNGSLCLSEGISLVNPQGDKDLWCSPSSGIDQYFAYMQDNGNLCVNHGRPTTNRGKIWCWSNSNQAKSNNYKAVIHDDGYFAVFGHFPFAATENMQPALWISSTPRIGLKYAQEFCFSNESLLSRKPRMRAYLWYAVNGASKSFDTGEMQVGAPDKCVTLPQNTTSITYRLTYTESNLSWSRACDLLFPRLIMTDSTVVPGRIQLGFSGNNPDCVVRTPRETAYILPIKPQR